MYHYIHIWPLLFLDRPATIWLHLSYPKAVQYIPTCKNKTYQSIIYILLQQSFFSIIEATTPSNIHRRDTSRPSGICHAVLENLLFLPTHTPLYLHVREAHIHKHSHKEHDIPLAVQQSTSCFTPHLEREKKSMKTVSLYQFCLQVCAE